MDRNVQKQGSILSELDRRDFVGLLSALGFGVAFSSPAIWTRNEQRQRLAGEMSVEESHLNRLRESYEDELTAEPPVITEEMLGAAAAVIGLQFTDEERELMLEGINERLELYEQLRSVSIPHGVLPAIHFDPVLPGTKIPTEREPFRIQRTPGLALPADQEVLAFFPVTKLSELVRTRKISSLELTRMYLGRLKRYGSVLKAVITLTVERALEQARQLDAEIASGKYRGPLHGIPWGAKDLFAARGYPTTWGATPFKNQILDYDATVVQRLDEAGAVLVGKLAMGSLAQGDVWFGGKTRNPWNIEQGSGGSSSGSTVATVAGLVAFTLGTETLGSIISPSTQCGATGLRPTFGRVSRHGAMALSWSMDKVGPICRAVGDCATILHAIQGPDGNDPTVRSVPLDWTPNMPPSDLRVGFLPKAFDADHSHKALHQAVLDVLRSLGVDLIPIELPDQYPLKAIRRFVLDPEEGAVFDELTRSGRDDLLVRQEEGARPDRLRKSRFIPGVEYLQANRLRTMLMGSMQSIIEGIDVFVTPPRAENLSVITNLTGHPEIVVPCGFTQDGMPAGIAFAGKLYGDAAMMALAKAYQDATDFHLKRPPRFS